MYFNENGDHFQNCYDMAMWKRALGLPTTSYKNGMHKANLIPKKTDKVRQYINQSHLMYLQPDLETNTKLYVESLFEFKPIQL